MKKMKVILIGAGGRGTGYTDIMAEYPDKFEIVAVAEPLESRRNHIKEKHNLTDEQCFTDWVPLLELGKIADVALIGTMDRDHLAPSLKAISLGYHLLLEKPIAPTPEECKLITEAADEKNVKVVICTVLRYTAFFTTIKKLILEGRLGEIMSVNHEECVGNEHQSHSFVRGNWGNEERSSSMLLQKSCHDMDILQWLIGKRVKKIQSFGTLSYFVSKNAPEGAPDYCYQGCPAKETCFYDAEKIYIKQTNEETWFRRHAAQESEPSDERMWEVIKNTNYGKCVFKCDNNVVDHQTVNMLFEDNITVTFSMNAFNQGGRNIHIMGTKAELTANMEGDSSIKIYDFDTKKTEEISMYAKDGIGGGHGGGDTGIVLDLYDYLNNCYTGISVPEIKESYLNHLIAFAAEESRKNGGILIDFDEYEKNIK